MTSSAKSIALMILLGIILATFFFSASHTVNFTQLPSNVGWTMEPAISRKSQFQAFPTLSRYILREKDEATRISLRCFLAEDLPSTKTNCWLCILFQDSYFIACSISHLNHHRIKTTNIYLNSAPPHWYTSLYGTKSGRLETVRRNIMNSKISTNKGGGVVVEPPVST